MQTIIAENHERLDVCAARALPQLSRAYVQRLCDQGSVLVNNEPRKPGYKLRIGDKVTINIDLDTFMEAPAIDLPIIYEDDDCLVINKPAGVLTHSNSPLYSEGTVASFLRGKITGNLEGHRAGVVHRLDRATSGVIIGAKNEAALSWLQKQFAQRRTRKTYLAIITGTPDPAEALIDIPIERNPKDPKSFRPHVNGKPSQTAYKVLQQNSHHALIELKPVTGRTHQLRVHMKHINHPIIGDLLYETEPAERLFLHAASLEITLPNRERKVFEAPLPEEFMIFMELHP